MACQALGSSLFEEKDCLRWTDAYNEASKYREKMSPSCFPASLPSLPSGVSKPATAQEYSYMATLPSTGGSQPFALQWIPASIPTARIAQFSEENADTEQPRA